MLTESQQAHLLDVLTGRACTMHVHFGVATARQLTSKRPTDWISALETLAEPAHQLAESDVQQCVV